ncbi:MAG TPA: hypothetical protein VG722_07995 [Tepidisphaeraceae bacterium]|nr:hypothetical protein [Tepidisphaeraceae bacterium]
MSVSGVASHSSVVYQPIRNQNQAQNSQKPAQQDADGDNDGSTGVADKDKGSMIDTQG